MRITINGKSSSSTVYDEIIDVRNVNFEYKENDVLDGYEIKHFSFSSLEQAKGKRKQFEDKIRTERVNGFAVLTLEASISKSEVPILLSVNNKYC